MDTGYKLKHENLKKTTNFLSKLFFIWMIKICYKATKKGLLVIDLYKLLKCDKSEILGVQLEKNWKLENIRAKGTKLEPSLLRALIKTFIWSYMFYGMLLFIQVMALRSVQPVVLAYLMILFEKTELDTDCTKRMYILAIVLVGISILSIFLMHHCNFGQSAIGMQVRIALSSLVYRKIMKLNKKSLSQIGTGQIVNLLSNDVSRFDFAMIVLHYIWILPFQLILITYLIWQEVDISCLAGVLALTLYALPIQSYLGKITSQIRLKVAKTTDIRVKLMNEVISGIQVIKMYAWEKPFEKIIKCAREREINELTKASYLRGIYCSCEIFLEKITLYLTVVCYVVLGNTISADNMFSMALFLNTLQLSMAYYYPQAILFGAETLVSIKRLQDFLIMEEKEQLIIESINKKEINLTNLEANWIVSKTPTLQSLNFHIRPGTLCAVVGPVGAGKSSLLQLLLGELPVTVGKIQIGGNISYSSQEPWLFESTVRKNILFGQEYNKFRYENVVKVCALKKDFKQFPQGDQTVVGERGVCVSGGQKARINLARSVYRKADIYLMDDPISAVDSHVGRHLFEECILKYLKYKTRILVTHQLQYLKRADYIIVLNEGKIEAQGTFEELLKLNLKFSKILATVSETKLQVEPAIPVLSRSESTISSLSYNRFRMEEIHDLQNKEEMIMTGISPLKEYFKAAGSFCIIIILIVVLIMGQVTYSGADFWVAYWTEQETLRHSNTTELPRKLLEVATIPQAVNNFTNTDLQSRLNSIQKFKISELLMDTVMVKNETHMLFKTDIAMHIYTVLVITTITFATMRSFLFFKIAMFSSKNLHNTMFQSLLQAPMRFFKMNSSGRVLNRFSKDIGAIDEILPRVLIEAIHVALMTVGRLLNITMSNVYFLIPAAVLGVIFLKMLSYYITTTKNIKHLEGITKSPVFSHISSSLNGITTIRASKLEVILINEFDNHQDVHTSAWLLKIACVACFGLWLDAICVVFTACVIFSFVVLRQFGEVNGSLVGLAISQSVIITGVLQYGMRQMADVANQLTSVERVLQYTQLEKEGPFETPKELLPTMQRSNEGLIIFKNLYLTYAPTDPPVLKNLNFIIYPGEKIGIVGRTGAGKSSLISALFRLAPLEGNIFIDGVDSKLFGLSDLRKRISIIPQEPFLFLATLRYNLDPFGEYDDNILWNALEELKLKDLVPSLHFVVSEGGSNFSLGQRQLICLARAILKKNNILVLDEATANVDSETDILIQATIRRKFKNSTVLTIAHRLNTIMDSDKVLVIDDGIVLEFDHPHLLLQNPESHFLKMIEETGPEMMLKLKEL